MPWVVSNGGSSNYDWNGNNTYNQHAAIVNFPVSCAVTELRVIAAGYNTGTVATRVCLWNNGGSIKAQSSTFNMSDGSESAQYTYEINIPDTIISAGNYMVGLYRSPGESHIFKTATGASGYKKTNTNSFPNVASMSGYTTDSNDEPTVGAFYITTPAQHTSVSATRNSDTSITVNYYRHADADQPVYNQQIERWDNVTNNWYWVHTNGTDYSTNGAESWTDASVQSNRNYRYRTRAGNTHGYCSYVYTDYVHTTPAVPSNVVATRSGGNVNITWTDNSYEEDQFRIQRRESTDEGDTWGSWADMSPATVAAGVTLATDTSPYTYGQYRVRAEDIDYTLYSSYVESNEVVTLSIPDAPTGINPDYSVFDATEAKIFSWNHNPTDSTAQTKFSLQIKEDGGSYPGTPDYDEEVSTNEYVEIPASTFINGTDYYWQIKTWGEHATGSDWSSEGVFYCLSRPIATILNPTIVDNYAYSELELSWEFTQSEGFDQIQYLAKLYDNNNVLLETKQVSSLVADSTTDSCIFDYVLENNTTYKCTLQVQETNALWSAESEVEFTTQFLEPIQPTIVLTEDTSNGTVNIDITNPEVVTEYNNNTTQDTYIDNDNSTTNYNDNGQLLLNNDTDSGTNIKTILLDFDLSFFAGKTIVDAQLQLYRKTALTPGIDSKVNYIKTSWDESNVTHSTAPTLDTTDYDDHTHSVGDSETWDITDLVSDITDGTITDFEGIAIVASTINGSVDEFYDSTITDNEPALLIEISPENAETSYNTVYRSIDNGLTWEIVQNNVPINTSITDYIPSISGYTWYYVDAISTTPSSKASESSSVNMTLTGLFFINGEENYSTICKMLGNINLSQSKGRNSVLKQYKGRENPVRYQGDVLKNEINFGSDCPFATFDILISLLESVGDLFYRDWHGNYFKCDINNQKFDLVDNLAYQFTCNITKVV